MRFKFQFREKPVLEPAFLYGGCPFKDLTNKFLMAKPSIVELNEDDLPAGLKIIKLRGHFFDEVCFLADSLFSEETINKYHVFFIYDVSAFINPLSYLETVNAKVFVPPYGEITNDISNLIRLNRDKVMEISNKIINACNVKITYEEILKSIFEEYNLVMNANQYVLIGSTMRTFCINQI